MCGQWDLGFHLWDFEFHGRDLASSQFLQWDLEPAGIKYIILNDIPGDRIPSRNPNVSNTVRILGGRGNHFRENPCPRNAAAFESSDKVSLKGPGNFKTLGPNPQTPF